MGKCPKVVAHHLNRGVPFGAVVASGREDFRIRHETYLNEKPFHGTVGYKTESYAKGYRDKSESERDSPFVSTDTRHLERRAADEHNQNLDCNFC